MSEINGLGKKEIIDPAKAKSEIARILDEKFEMLLFGSYSRSEFSKYSDVDIFILVERT